MDIEYLIISLSSKSDAEIQNKLNELSLVGWQLEFVLPDGRHYFKRYEVEL
ncbi:hypothetical protein KQI30_04655 [Clostridium bornimense]|uniref:hypothetical protein n=1 Tax=Clostridium bornimense TaxID=1216932 RepID=UPI001C118FE2|nr:hypothetical protein [Clostridium bornimense]MBU5315565.1 hypothetical protein [Clostridium bornimense]